MVEEPLDLHVAMLLSQLNRGPPMIQQHTAINSLLVFAHLLIALDSILSHPRQLESVSQLIQQWIVLRDLLNNLGKGVVVFDHREALDEASVVFGS